MAMKHRPSATSDLPDPVGVPRTTWSPIMSAMRGLPPDEARVLCRERQSSRESGQRAASASSHGSGAGASSPSGSHHVGESRPSEPCVKASAPAGAAAGAPAHVARQRGCGLRRWKARRARRRRTRRPHRLHRKPRAARPAPGVTRAPPCAPQATRARATHSTATHRAHGVRHAQVLRRNHEHGNEPAERAAQVPAHGNARHQQRVDHVDADDAEHALAVLGEHAPVALVQHAQQRHGHEQAEHARGSTGAHRGAAAQQHVGRERHSIAP